MALVWAGFAAFFVAALAVGLRLVALAVRTGRAPELLIGLGVLGIGPVGIGLQTGAGLVEMTRARQRPWPRPERLRSQWGSGRS